MFAKELGHLHFYFGKILTALAGLGGILVLLSQIPLLQKLRLSSPAALDAKVCHEVVNRECVINLEGIKHPP